MNQEDVKKNLLKLHDCTDDFMVIFTGKKNRKVNGLYRPDTREIIIHNRNFHKDEGGNNDNLLFYTAIHEFAHHIQFTENKQKSARAHTQSFYAALDDLVDLAEKKKLYKIEVDEETQKLVDEARDISCEIAELQRKLGQVLIQLNESCLKKGIRYEDVTSRKTQISQQTMKRSTRAHCLNIPEDVGADIQEAAIKERDEEKREAIIHAGQNGKSVAQAKKSTTSYAPQEDETVSLMKEKGSLERTITALSRRLEEVAEQLKSRGEL
jgi:hypothetical protein